MECIITLCIGRYISLTSRKWITNVHTVLYASLHLLSNDSSRDCNNDISALASSPPQPRHFNRPNAERPHVADGAVVLLFVVGLRGLVAQPHPLIYGLVDALGRTQSLPAEITQFRRRVHFEFQTEKVQVVTLKFIPDMSIIICDPCRGFSNNT